MLRELSLHVLDIAKNSTAAGATLVKITLKADRSANVISFRVEDNGRGMSPEFLRTVTDPFTTTRTTRKVGMGLPLLKMAAEAAGGEFAISSEAGVGTSVFASFRLNHIDRMPLGDFGGSIAALVGGDPGADFLVTCEADGQSFALDTREMRETMGGISLAEPEVLEFIRSFLNENLQSLYGGIIE